jgi:hypothetical protein
MCYDEEFYGAFNLLHEGGYMEYSYSPQLILGE